MSSIDQRIVEMQFDNRQFERGVETSIKSLDSLKKGLNLDGSTKSLNSLQKAGKHFSLDNLASNVQTVTDRFSALGAIGFTALQRITNAAITTGKHLVSALTIDPIKTGFREYETQIGAIQTILSNTRSKGTTLDSVNAALDQLNTYADKTIYNFTEMTRNIGTFTAAGIDLDKSVAAIKGISNLAAVSGSTSMQASTAMYQLSQALSSGTVRLMDWNSVVNAGMGGEVFQNALKETAKVHGVAIDSIIKKQGSFRESLQEGWLNSEILLETLKKFTGDYTKEELLSIGYTADQANEIIKLGKDANDAATKVKTFSQLMETLKEAVGSGWTQTWENFIGNFEESKKLWTGISDALGSIINKNAQARNDLLSKWKELGGRDDLLTGLTDIFQSLWSIVVAVGDAMDDIFPPTTVENLLALSKGVKDFGAQLKAVLYYREKLLGYEERSEKVEGTDSTSDLTRGSKGEDVKKLQQKLKDLGEDLGSAGVDGIFGSKTEAALKSFQEKNKLTVTGKFDVETKKAMGIEDFSTRIYGVAQYLNIFSDSLEKINKIAKGVFAIFHVGVQVLTFFWNVIKHVVTLFAPLGNALLTMGAAVGDMLSNFDEWLESSGVFTRWLENVKTFLAPVGVLINDVSKSILNFFGFGEKADSANDKITTFTQLWTKLKDAVAKTGIWDKIVTAFGKVKDAFKGIGPVFKDYYDNAKKYLGEKFTAFLGKVAEKLPKFVEGVGNFFVKVLDFIAPLVSKIPKAIEFVRSFFSGLTPYITGFVGKVPGFMTKIRNFFVGLYTQLSKSEKFQNAVKKITAVLSTIISTLKDFFKMVVDALTEFFSDDKTDSSSTEKGIKNKFDFLTKIGNWLSKVWGKVLATFGKAFEGANNLLNQFGVGGLIGAVVTALGLISVYKLIRSVTGVFDGLKGIIKVLKNNVLGKGKIQPLSKSILEIAVAIGLIVGAIYILGKMDPDVLRQGAIVLGSILFVLVALTAACAKLIDKDMTKTIGTAGKAILNLAIGLAIIAGAIYLLGKMKPETLLRGGLAMAAILTGLGIFLAVMKKWGSVNVNYKGLIGVAVAIGILGLIARMLGGMDQDKLWQGILSMGAIMLELAAFIILVNNLGGNSVVSYKGLFGAVVAIGLLAGLVYLFRNTTWDDVKNGLLIVGSIMLELAGFMILVNLVGKKATVKYAGLIAVAAAIGILAGIVVVLGSIKAPVLKQGLKALAAISVILAGLVFVIGKFSQGVSIGKSLLVVGELILLIMAFAVVINLIRNVDPKVMTSFAESLALSLAALIGAILVVEKFGGGVKGMAKGAAGIVAALAIIIAGVAGIVAGLGWLDDATNGGFKEKIESGASVLDALSTAITNLCGSIENAEAALGLITLASGLSGLFGFGKMAIGALGIDAALALIVGGVSGIVVSLGALDDATEGGFVDKLNSGADVLWALGNAIGSFIAGVKGLTTGEQSKSLYTEELTKFGDSITTFADQMAVISGNSDLPANTDKATAIAQKMHDFFVTLTPYDINYGALESYATAPAQLSTDMKSFGNAIQAFRIGVYGLGDDKAIDSDTYKAKTIATIIHDFFVDLATVKPDQTNLTNYNEAAKNLFDNMSKMGTTVSDFKTNVSGIAKSGLILDTVLAIANLKLIAWFLESLKDVKIEENKSAIEKFFTGDKIDTVFDKVTDLGSAVASVATAFATVDSNFSSQTENVLAAMRAISGFLSYLSSDEVTVGWYELDNVIWSLNDLGLALQSFGTNTANVDSTKLSSLARATKSIVTSLVDVSTNGITTETVSTLKTIIGDFADIFSGDDAVTIDTSKFLDKLDSESIVSKLASFTSSVGTAMGTSTTAMAGYTTSFNAAGAGLGSSLNAGVSAGGSDTSGVKSVCNSLLSAINNFKTSFWSAGYNLGVGLGQGLRNSTLLATLAAKSVAQAVLKATKDVFREKSPSKAFKEIGKYGVYGLANGFRSFSKVATKAAEGVGNDTLDSTRNTLSNLSNLVNSNLESEPVVRPVVDLSDVSAGARAINGMLSTRGTVSVDSVQSKKLANSISSSSQKKSQNGSSSGSSSGQIVSVGGPTIDLSHGNWNIRDANDARLLAQELAYLANQENRNLGAPIPNL